MCVCVCVCECVRARARVYPPLSPFMYSPPSLVRSLLVFCIYSSLSFFPPFFCISFERRAFPPKPMVCPSPSVYLSVYFSTCLPVSHLEVTEEADKVLSTNNYLLIYASLFACLSACLPACLFVCLPIYLSQFPPPLVFFPRLSFPCSPLSAQEISKTLTDTVVLVPQRMPVASRH